MKRIRYILVIPCLIAYLALGPAPLRAQWIDDGVLIYTGVGGRPGIVSDGIGGAILAWASSAGNIYAQRIDATGVVLWGPSGVLVCGALGTQSNPGIVSDGAGGAIIGWYDGRSGGSGIYAQRVDVNGAAQWAADGIRVCSTATAPRLISDDAGGAIVGYSNGIVGGGDVFVQRIGADGSLLWGTEGVSVCATQYIESDFDIAPDGAHGVIVAVVRNYYQNSTAVYSGRVDAAGTVHWWSEGMGLYTDMAMWESNIKMAYNGAGKAIVTWQGWWGDDNIHAQQIDTSGAIGWGGWGRSICSAANGQGQQQIVADGSGGAVIAWSDARLDYGDIYAQRITMEGTVLWAADGVPVCTAPGYQGDCSMISYGAGGAVLAWSDRRADDENYDIYTQRLDATGASLWMADGAVVCDAAGSQQYSAIAHGGTQGFIVGWLDNRTGTAALYAAGGSSIVTALPQGSAASIALFQNRPNPFNPSTTIGYRLAEAGHVVLEVYDAGGARIALLVDERQAGGDHKAVWDGKNDAGATVGSGVYFCRLATGKETLTRKMVLLK